MGLSVFLGFILIQSSYAEEEPFSFGSPPQKYLSTGLTTGASFTPSGNGVYLGGECNYVRLKKQFWMGVYTDAVYDFGQAAATVTLGPKIGLLAFGLDGGLGLRTNLKDQTELGFQTRAMLNLGLFSLYYRYGGWPDSGVITSTHQTGISLKMPFPLTYEPRPISP